MKAISELVTFTSYTVNIMKHDVHFFFFYISDNSGEEEGRMKRQTSVPSIEPGPSD